MRLRKLRNLLRLPQFDATTYRPRALRKPTRGLEIISAWKGHELIIEDILERFQIPRRTFLEFGVEFGFSAVAFSSYFDQVVGVDTFQGDEHTNHRGDHYDQTRERLAAFPYIKLVRSDYADFIKQHQDPFDLAHVDIIHTYEDTYACGLWCAQRCRCTLFHDTESFPEVRRAVRDIAKVTGKRFYNYRPHYGLGIVA
jgi:hypothetical protein